MSSFDSKDNQAWQTEQYHTENERDDNSQLPSAFIGVSMMREKYNTAVEGFFPRGAYQTSHSDASKTLQGADECVDTQSGLSGTYVNQYFLPEDDESGLAGASAADSFDQFQSLRSLPGGQYDAFEAGASRNGHDVGQAGPSNWVGASLASGQYSDAGHARANGSGTYPSAQSSYNGISEQSARASSIVTQAASSRRPRSMSGRQPALLDFQLAPGLFVNPGLAHWNAGYNGGFANAPELTAMELRRLHGSGLGNVANDYRQESDLLRLDLHEVGSHIGEDMPPLEVVCRHNRLISQCSSRTCRRHAAEERL